MLSLYFFKSNFNVIGWFDSFVRITSPDYGGSNISPFENITEVNIMNCSSWQHMHLVLFYFSYFCFFKMLFSLNHIVILVAKSETDKFTNENSAELTL
jgi:hypothetical protein